MAINKNLIIDSMLVIDETGMPVPPTVRQLVDKDIRELYTRDKSKDKSQYVKECIVIYYLGDPKSPARQAGLGDVEALKMAITQAGLSDKYIPDGLVQRLANRYYAENITEAGKVVENLMKSIHNVNLMIDMINTSLNEKLHSNLSNDELNYVITLMDAVKKQAGDIPSILKKLEEAKQNLMYERETEVSRGGNQILSSMDAESYK